MTTQRRILCLIRWPVGGIRTYIHYMYPALAEAGFTFTFAGPADESFRAFRQELRGWDDAEWLEIPCETNADLLRPALRAVVKSGRFALIHSQGLTSALQANIANWGVGVPHVVTSHDVFRAEQFVGWKGALKRRLMTRLLRPTDVIINVSQDAQQNLLEYMPGLRHGGPRIVTIQNGIDIGRFDRRRCRRTGWLRGQLGLRERTVLWGFLGRFVEQKGFLTLVEALAELSADDWHLAAFGGSDLVREYRAEVSRRHLAERVTFLDFRADVEHVLPELDALVMPSLWEACPLLPMEAMSLGVPVVGSDCLGLREVLHGSPGLAPPAGDAVALAGALREVLARPRDRLAVDYAELARARFDSRHGAQRLCEELHRAGCGRSNEARPFVGQDEIAERAWESESNGLHGGQVATEHPWRQGATLERA